MNTRHERERVFHDHAYSDDTRAGVARFYEAAVSSRSHYFGLLDSLCAGKRVLECGCGTGETAFQLAGRAAHVTGIDLSEVAIQKAELKRGRLDARDRISFRVMNAEQLEFPDASFDLVCGSGVLHHLQLEAVFSELRRALTPDGQAVFMEPMGHNILVNAFRMLTPRLRTPDEHPLRMPDTELARRYFANVSLRFFHLLSLFAIPLPRSGAAQALTRTLDAADAALLRGLPFLRRYCWIVVLRLSAPRE